MGLLLEANSGAGRRGYLAPTILMTCIADPGRYVYHPMLVDLLGESDREKLRFQVGRDEALIACQDTIPGLTELKRHVNINILTLSNGSFRLFLNLVIESPLYGSDLSNQRYRQRTKVFPAMKQKGLPIRSTPPFFTSSQDGHVAAHKCDPLAAASVGFKTIYAPRTKDSREHYRASKEMAEMRTNKSYYMQFVVVEGKLYTYDTFQSPGVHWYVRHVISSQRRFSKINASLDDSDSFSNVSIALHGQYSVVVTFRFWNRIRYSSTIIRMAGFTLKLIRTVLTSSITRGSKFIIMIGA
ncbi:hypothetical protein BDR07DRAFT_1463565 [Suillus spraguei]|nr:hypothetical protein BDR07DRAFT_1463565 [Suillus spraguei]